MTHSSRLGVVPVTQLGPPAVPRTGIARPRLHDAVSAAVEGPLTLLVAPAGFGKTVLLSSWVADAANSNRVAWFTVDRRDDDPGRFWAGILAAVRRSVTDSSAAALAEPKKGFDEEFLATLMNHFCDAEESLVLIVDDFDLVGDTTVLEGVDYLLRHAPSQLRVVIAARSDPLLSVGRLRVRRELTEIRAGALAFTREEAGDLLGASGVHLPDDEVDTLVARTEGWAAGLALAAMALEGAPDPGARVARFAGDDRAVADFLATEVLAGIPAHIHDFLVQTSVVEQICPPLAEALTGRADSSEILQELVRSNAFVQSLDSSGHWYRCHSLFLQLLRNELARAGSTKARALHRRAAEWFGANERPLDAVRHALDAEDWRLASSLVREHWLDAFFTGRGTTMSHLVAQLPPAAAEADPQLALACAAGSLEAGKVADADRYLQIARDRGAGARNDAIGEALAIVTLSRARVRGDFEAAMACAGTLLEDGGDEFQSTLRRPRRRALAMLLLGEAELWTDKVDEARSHLRAALALARECEDDYIILGCLSHLAWLEALQGRLRPADELGREAIALARLRGYATDGSIAPAHLAVAAAQLEWNDPAAAQSIRQAAAATPNSAHPVLHVAVALVEARIRARDEGPMGAQRGLERLQAALDGAGGDTLPRSFAQRAAGVVASLLLTVGEADEAATWLGTAERSAYLAVVEARLALAAADPGRAVEVLVPYVHEACDAYLGTRVEALVLEAMAHRARFEPELALESVERALDLADPDGFRWRFLIAGTVLRELLLQRIRWGTGHRALVDEVLTEIERGGAQDRELLDPLTDREETVLRYLPTLLSNAEIASELFVSINTVKAHVKSIYRKLGTSRRKDAVVRARELRLL